MSLKNTIQEDMKTAMRSGDKERLGVIRMLLAALKQREVDERIELDDAAVIAIVDKQIKQRQEASKQFRDANRPELSDQEDKEIVFLKPYLPEPLSSEETENLIKTAITSTGASSMKDMGQVMALIKQQAAGRIDMSQVSVQIRKQLGAS